MIQSINPTTGEVVAEYEAHGPHDVGNFIEIADARHREWRRLPFGERAQVLNRAGDELERRREELAHLMTAEMGKTIGSARAEVDKCAWVCRHYAEHAEAYLQDVHISTESSKSYVHHTPLGVVLAVMPWNFPLWQVFRFAAPALMAGNAGVLKHASNVTGSALAIQEIIAAAGAPEGLFRTLILPASRVDEVLEHPLVRAATLTGSGPAGAAVAAKAGSLLKKTVLELGGSDPYVVLDDADVAAAATTCANSRLINSGQSCIAAKRFIVDESVHDEFVDAFVAAMEAKVMGDPVDETTQLGPQARVDLRDELHEQVERSVAAGATLATGGQVPDGPGAFYPATVLTNVKPDSPAYTEELFGPVASVIAVPDEESAIRVANDTDFGLGAAVFTTDLERGERIAAEWIEAGACFVNALVASDPRLPFGGIKQSGYGRELADLGIKEFVNQKTVVVP